MQPASSTWKDHFRVCSVVFQIVRIFWNEQVDRQGEREREGDDLFYNSNQHCSQFIATAQFKIQLKENYFSTAFKFKRIQ